MNPDEDGNLCLAQLWDDFGGWLDECVRKRGHSGNHAAEREDGTHVYWRNDGVDVLTGEPAYFYHGKLVGVDDTCVLLEGTKIVYDTGEWNAKEWQFAEDLPGAWYVQTAFIESFGRAK